MPEKVNDLIPGIGPISFSQATMISLVCTPRFSDASNMACTEPMCGPFRGIPSKVCPVMASRSSKSGSPERVATSSACRNRSAAAAASQVFRISRPDPAPCVIGMGIHGADARGIALRVEQRGVPAGGMIAAVERRATTPTTTFSGTSTRRPPRAGSWSFSGSEGRKTSILGPVLL